MSASVLSIQKKIAGVMEMVKYLQKDKANAAQGYRYLSEAAIKGAFNEAFIAHGLTFSFSVESVNHDTVETAKGAKMMFATVSCVWTITDIETGETVTGKSVGTGSDSLDKAVYKAITGALKYALTSNFLVETGDDAENDTGTTTEAVSSQPTPAPAEAAPPRPMKICVKCKKDHNGSYPTCLACWKNERKAD